MADGTRDLVFRLFGRDVNASRTLKKVGREADEAGLKLRGLGTAMKVFTGGAAATALPGTMNVISAAVVGLTGAVATLPAVAAAGGAGLGALALATWGFADAIKEVRDPEKFAEALKLLAPAAAEAARSVRSLMPELDNLRANVSQNFFAQFTGQIAGLAGKFIPLLRAQLSQIAANAGSGASGLGSFLGQPAQLEQIRTILASTATATFVLGQALQPAAAAMLTLTTTGSQFLPSMAAAIGQAAASLSVFLANAQQSGQLATFMAQGLSTVQQLGQTLLSVGSILGSVFGAAGGAGGGPLGSLNAVLASIAATVAGPAFQQGLGQFFAQLSAGGQQVAAVMPQVGAAIAAIGPALGSVVQGLAGGFAGTLQTISQLVISLAPTINYLSSQFAMLAPAVVPMLVVGAGIARIVGPIAAVASGIGRAVAVFRSLSTVIKMVVTWFRVLGLALSLNPLGLIITAVGLLVAGLVIAYKKSDTFRAIVNAAFRAAASVVLTAVSGILSALQKLFQAASRIPGIGNAMSGVASAMNNAKGYIDGVRASLAAIPTSVGVAVNVRYNVSASGPAGLLGYGKYGGYGQGLGVIKDNAGTQQVTLGSPAVSAPKTTYGNLAGGMGNVGSGAGESLGKGVGKGIEKTKDYSNHALVRLARGIASRLQNAMTRLQDIVKRRADYIKQIRDNLIAATSITGFEKDQDRRGTPKADYYVAYLRNRLKALRSFAANIRSLRKNGLNRTTLEQILNAGVDGGADDAASLAAGGKRTIAQINKIQKGIGKEAQGVGLGLGNKYFNEGVSAAKGLVRGLKSQRKDLQKEARGLAKDLRKAIRDELKIKSPSRALAEDGRYAGLGFVLGVRSQHRAASRALTGLSRPGAVAVSGRRNTGGQVVEQHFHLHAGAVIDSTNVIRQLDGMAKTALARGYRPQTLATTRGR